MELCNDTTTCCVEGIARYSLIFTLEGPFVGELLGLFVAWQDGSS